ncbi:MAG: SMI1/KNR4 family protein [Holophagales bacterium]|nr:SMI1/KNR4 family protein [Holophagales bacterium]
MVFVNYELLEQAYPAGRMKKNVRRLKDHGFFHHYLLAGSSARAPAVKKRAADLPADYLKWLEVCDDAGAISHDIEFDLPLSIYGNCYNAEHNAEPRKDRGIPKDWFIFAVGTYIYIDDVFFFDMEKKDGHVYQWDEAEGNIRAIWFTFEDWLTDQINEDIEFIANERLKLRQIKRLSIRALRLIAKMRRQRLNRPLHKMPRSPAIIRALRLIAKKRRQGYLDKPWANQFIKAQTTIKASERTSRRRIKGQREQYIKSGCTQKF